ncbi:extracellular solute-binding protein [Streptomyces sp. SID3343]|uniref:extracellular solute-binding protein n=1 Tax=Streptomyces sp. SID3343 TaxID=2690260 RepID=UPI001367B72A|nr:extracellular solute-binding protein [Streptomyces sp. SID3343]MYW04667.1 extracellular solute-binding protein [Streptomyces sp. SID3343]MYW04848.1 extracellular solute-binding protein [Streptomyces sp. SID3343]
MRTAKPTPTPRSGRRIGAVLAAFATGTTLALSGCATPGDSPVAATAPTHLSGTIQLWHHYTSREAKVFQSVVDDFERKNPDVKVRVHSGQQDTKITQVVASGGDVDVLITNVNATLGTACKSMSDLEPYMRRDNVSADAFQGIFAGATAFNGRRCSLPTTSDVYGLYFNTTVLNAAGYTQPPRTLQELEDMALKLTTFNGDGSIKTLGFNPLIGTHQNTSATFSGTAGVTWTKDGDSAIASSPQWQRLMTWQHDFVRKIGYDKLKTFTAGLGDEWSANNSFQTGRVAMALDGEWRVAFVDEQAPNLAYGTAPFPILADSGAQYGGGFASAADVGVNKRSGHKEAAWALVKYLATDTDAAVKLANGLKNIPTLKSAAASPHLEATPQYRTFIEASGHPASNTSPVTEIGSTLAATMDNFWTGYQQGAGGGLLKGLKDVDTDINNALGLRRAK